MAEKIKIDMDPELRAKLTQNVYSENMDKHRKFLNQFDNPPKKNQTQTTQSTKNTHSTKTNNADVLKQKNKVAQSDAELKNPISDKVKGQTTSSQQCSAVAQNGKKCANFCREEGFFILPVSYAVTTTESSVKALPQNLGKNVSQIALTKHKYTVKMIDRGYIYVFFKRGNEAVWKAYITNVKGYHDEFPIGNPAPLVAKDFACKSNGHSFRASFISIPEIKPNDVSKVYIIHTHAPLSASKRKEFQNNADSFVAKGYWQKIDISQWKSGNQKQEHCFAKPNLDTIYLANRNFDGGRWASIQNEFFCMAKTTCAIALYDAIGITRQLNDDRNIHAFGGIDGFLQKKENGTTNNHKLQTLNLVDNIQKAINEKIIKTKYNAIDANKNTAVGHILHDHRVVMSKEDREKIAQRMEENHEKSVDIQAKRAQADIDAVKEAENGFKKYQNHLNMDALSKFRAKVDDLSKTGYTTAVAYQDDHYNWLTSNHLLNGLYYFDQNEKLETDKKNNKAMPKPSEVSNGFIFHMLVMDLMHGMTFLKKGQQLIDKWINEQKVEEKNLYLRAYCFNNKQLMANYDQTFSAGGDGAKNTVDYSKQIFGVFKAADEVFDKWLESISGKAFITANDLKRSDKMFYWMSIALNSTLNAFSKIKMQTLTVGSITGVASTASRTHAVQLFYLRTGDLSKRVPLSSLFYNIEFNKAAEAVIQGQSSHYKNPFVLSVGKEVNLYVKAQPTVTKNRILAIVGIFELLNFYFQYDAWKSDALNKPEVTAQLVGSCLTLTSAVLELLGESWGQQEALKATAAKTKLTAASFGIIGSAIGIIIDGKSIRDTDNKTLETILIFKIMTNFTIFLSQSLALYGLILSIGGAEAKKRAIQYSASSVVAFLTGARLITTLNLFVLGATATEMIAKKYFLDNDLEDWCQKSAFYRATSLDPNNKYKNNESKKYLNETDELEGFTKAIGSI